MTWYRRNRKILFEKSAMLWDKYRHLTAMILQDNNFDDEKGDGEKDRNNDRVRIDELHLVEAY